MESMKGNREMSRQPEISDKSTRNDPNKREDAKSITVIIPFPLPRQVPLPLHVPFPLTVPSANIYGMSEHSRAAMNRCMAPREVRTRMTRAPRK